MIGCFNEKTEGNKDSKTESTTFSKTLSTTPSYRNFSIDTIAYLKNNKESGDYWPASTHELEPKDLEFIPPSELRIIRNEIFARKGYIFKSNDLKNYFESKKWYKPLFKKVDHLLTTLELENIKIIRQKEQANRNFSTKEQLDIFISYQDSGGVQTPEMLSFKFGESCIDCFRVSSPYRFIKSILPKSTNRHLIFESYLLCDQCDYTYSVVTYSIEGVVLDNIELGSGQFEITSDDSFKFINITTTVSEVYKDSVDVLDAFELEYDQDSLITNFTLKNGMITKLQ